MPLAYGIVTLAHVDENDQRRMARPL